MYFYYILAEKKFSLFLDHSHYSWKTISYVHFEIYTGLKSFSVILRTLTLNSINILVEILLFTKLVLSMLLTTHRFQNNGKCLNQHQNRHTKMGHT